MKRPASSRSSAKASPTSRAAITSCWCSCRAAAIACRAPRAAPRCASPAPPRTARARCSAARAGCRATARRSITILGCSAFAEYATVSRRSLVKIDPELPLAEAALFGCAVLTGVGAVVNTAQVRAGASTAVDRPRRRRSRVGAGRACRAARAHIVAVDLSDDKLELAKALGATHTFNASATRLRRQDSRGDRGRRRVRVRARGLGARVRDGVQDHAPRRHHGHRRPAAADRDDAAVAASISSPRSERSRAATSAPACRRATFRATSTCIARASSPVDKLMTRHAQARRHQRGFDLLHEGKAVRQVVVF